MSLNLDTCHPHIRGNRPLKNEGHAVTHGPRRGPTHCQVPKKALYTVQYAGSRPRRPSHLNSYRHIDVFSKLIIISLLRTPDANLMLQFFRIRQQISPQIPIYCNIQLSLIQNSRSFRFLSCCGWKNSRSSAVGELSRINLLKNWAWIGGLRRSGSLSFDWALCFLFVGFFILSRLDICGLCDRVLVWNCAHLSLVGGGL